MNLILKWNIYIYIDVNIKHKNIIKIHNRFTIQIIKSEWWDYKIKRERERVIRRNKTKKYFIISSIHSLVSLILIQCNIQISFNFYTFSSSSYSFMFFFLSLQQSNKLNPTNNILLLLLI